MIYMLIVHIVSCVYAKYRTIEISGNATLGYYYMDIYLGDHTARESLIIDTGSSMITFPCIECRDCGLNHYNSRYDHSKSSGYQKMDSHVDFMGWKCGDGNSKSCPFSVSYVEGSGYEGHLIQDYLMVKDELVKFNVEKKRGDSIEKYRGVVGCTVKETGKFSEQEADGIIGFGLDTGSRFRSSSLQKSP